MTEKSIAVCFMFMAFLGGIAVSGFADDRVISPAIGFQPAHTYAMSDIESIDKATGSLSLHLPLAQLPPGPAGFTAGLTLVYNNKYWETEPIDNAYALTESFSGGWRLRMIPSLDIEYVQSKGEKDPCGYFLTSELFQMKLTNPDGSRNLFLLSKPTRTMSMSCDAGIYRISQLKNENASSVWYTADGSFLRLEIDAPSIGGSWPYNSSWTIYRQDGSSIRYEVASNITWLKDKNGNKIAITKTFDSANPMHSYEIMADEFGRTIRLDHYGEERDEVRQTGHDGTTMVWKVYYGFPGAIIPSSYICDQSIMACTFDAPPLQATRLELPNGLAYVFGYERTAPFPSNYRELRRVILPTGAQIEYGYRLDSKSTAANYFHVLANPLTSKTVSINGATVEKWEFAYDINASTGVFSKSTHKAPDGGTTSHLFNPISYRTSMGPDSGIITKIVNPDGSIVNRDWQTNFPREKPSSLQWANPWVRREWTTNVNSSGSPVATSIKVFTTDKNGNTTSVEERGWVPYSATLPEPWNAALIRKTISAFLNGASDSTNTTIADDKAYSSASIISPSTPRNLRTSIETLNAGGAVQARSQFSYTETSPTRTVGNLTAEYHWDSTKPGYATLSSGASLTANNSIMKTYTYTTRGNLKQEVDARGYVSTYDYGNIYGCPSSQTSSDLYRTGAHQGQNQADFLLNWSHSYNCNSGKQISTTDPNALVTSVDYDNYGRPVTIIDGNYRKTVHTYHDASLWIVSQRDVASFNDLKNVSVLHYDQLGRVRLSRQLETSISNPAAAAADESKGIKTDTKYVFSANRNETWVSNPYRGNELGSPTQGWTVKRLDKIGRICVEEWFAGAGNPMVAENCAASSGRTGAITNKYNASLNWTVEEIADATGKTRQLFRDVLGRPLAVREDPTSARYDTYYQHDLLDNMVSVRQAGTCGSSDPVASPCAGGQTRTFAYDSLKRLSSAMNPEMDGSLVSYQYDGNGNVKSKLNSGSPSLLVSYTYDYLNRLQVRDYSDGTTPPVTYCYDGKTWNGKVGGCTGSAAVPAKGRLTEVASSNSRSFYRYNAAGQIIGSVQTTAGKSFSFDYAYNAAFALTSQTFPSGRKILVDYDDAARQKYVQGQFAGSVTNYAGSAAKEIQYAAHGAVNSMTMANGISETRGYNSRLQLTRIQAGGLLSILNCYQAGDDANCASLATVSGNSGNLQGQRIARGSQTWTQQYTYDGANRLLTANETNGWQQRYGYDAYGNRWIMSSNGLPLNVLTPTSQASFSAATNRLVGANLYDSRGNLKSYGAYTLVYDGDDRIVTAGGAVRSAKYEYDGEGRRVRMHICSGSTACPGGADAVTTVYVYDAFGKLAAEYGPVTGQTGTSYFTLDHLGSTRLETNASGQQVSCSDYLPFGEEILAGYGNRNSCFASTDNRLKFTGKERDTETGLDFFGARYYASLQGRFTSLDLAEHDLVNPQTLNRYQYVVNNPLRYIDPNGLYERDVHIDLTSALALSAGFGETSANTIAVADQAVDDNHSSASYANRKNYHFTTSERRADLWDAFQESGTAYDLGTYLHTQQDAYSHAGYSPALGHAKDGTAPDKTYNDPSKATNMAKNTFVLLGRAAGRMGIDTNKGIAWEKISASVIKFNQAKSLAVKQKAIDEIRAIVKRAQEEKKKMEEPKIKQKRIGSIQ